MWKLSYNQGTPPFSDGKITYNLPGDSYGGDGTSPSYVEESSCTGVINVPIIFYMEPYSNVLYEITNNYISQVCYATTYMGSDGQKYTAGDEVTKNLVLTPIWDAYGTPSPSTIDLSKVPDPTRRGYTFDGWTTDDPDSVWYDSETGVYSLNLDTSDPFSWEPRRLYPIWQPEYVEILVEYAFQSLYDPNSYTGDSQYTTFVGGYVGESVEAPLLSNIPYGFHSQVHEPEGLDIIDYIDASDPTWVYYYDRNNYELAIQQPSNGHINASWENIDGITEVPEPAGVTVPYQTQVTLSVFADDRYEFVGWSTTGSVDDIISTSNKYTVEVSDNIVAPFAVIAEPEHPNLLVNVKGVLIQSNDVLVKDTNMWISAKKIYIKESGEWKTK